MAVQIDRNGFARGDIDAASERDVLGKSDVLGDLIAEVVAGELQPAEGIVRRSVRRNDLPGKLIAGGGVCIGACRKGLAAIGHAARQYQRIAFLAEGVYHSRAAGHRKGRVHVGGFKGTAAEKHSAPIGDVGE